MVAAQVFQSIVECFLTLLALRLLLERIVVGRRTVRGTIRSRIIISVLTARCCIQCIIVALLLERGVIVKLGIDVLFELGERHFQELHLQHLLL